MSGFEAHLSALIENRDLRISMGLKAQDRVRRDFNCDFTVGIYADALREIIERGQVPKDEREILAAVRPQMASTGVPQ